MRESAFDAERCHFYSLRFWLRPSSSVALIGKQLKRLFTFAATPIQAGLKILRSLFVENLAFVAEAKRFTLDRQASLQIERISKIIKVGKALKESYGGLRGPRERSTSSESSKL